MEPPESFQAEAVRSEKLKVWHSIAAIPLEHAIRGQYGRGNRWKEGCGLSPEDVSNPNQAQKRSPKSGLK